MIKVIRINSKIKLVWFCIWLFLAALSSYIVVVFTSIGMIFRNLLLCIGDLSFEPLKDTEHEIKQIANTFTE